MSSHQQFVDEAARQIVALITAKCGGIPPANVKALRRLCRHDFGVPALPIDAPDDFYGLVKGDIGGDNCTIIYNANLSEIDQVRVILHEMAEFIAMRDIPELWAHVNKAVLETAASAMDPTELRHLVAVEVEERLAKQMGIDQPRSTWPLTDILRVIPLDAKYVEPRDEIEHLPCDE